MYFCKSDLGFLFSLTMINTLKYKVITGPDCKSARVEKKRMLTHRLTFPRVFYLTLTKNPAVFCRSHSKISDQNLEPDNVGPESRTIKIKFKLLKDVTDPGWEYEYVKSK